MMQFYAVAACVIAAGAMADLQAENRLKPRAIIDRAIEEAGGREALARYQKPFRQEFANKLRWLVGKGDKKRVQTTEPASCITVWFPNKLRIEYTLMHGGRAVTVGVALHGNQGVGRTATQSEGELTFQDKSLEDDKVTLYSNSLYAQWVATLLPLDDKGFELNSLDEIMIDDRPAVGVRVSHSERPDVQLYFDKDAMTLVKLIYRANETTQEELTFDDFGDLEELVYPRVITSRRNDGPISEKRLTKFEILETVDEETFKKF